jgi:hypothetical protein
MDILNLDFLHIKTHTNCCFIIRVATELTIYFTEEDHVPVPFYLPTTVRRLAPAAEPNLAGWGATVFTSNPELLILTLLSAQPQKLNANFCISVLLFKSTFWFLFVFFADLWLFILSFIMPISKASCNLSVLVCCAI